MKDGTKVRVQKAGCDFNGTVGVILYRDENRGGKYRVEFSGGGQVTERKHYHSLELQPVA